MSKIIAGRFEKSLDADAALAALEAAGFRRGEFSSFYVTPPGQHGTYLIGGDQHADAGARHSGLGAAIGAALGTGVGLLAGMLVAGHYGVVAILLAAGLGAYVGSFAGAMYNTRDSDRQAGHRAPAEIPAGRMVAVNVSARPEMESRAAEILRRHGARDVGRAEGEWRDGDWRDFDPRAPLATM
jgi:hypothetical protein